MLPRQNRIKKEKDFEIIFKKGKVFKNNFLVLRFVNNNLKTNRLAIVISQKVSKKATERNKIRRRISVIVENIINGLKDGLDLVFLVLPQANNKSYLEIKSAVEDIIKKSGLLKNLN